MQQHHRSVRAHIVTVQQRINKEGRSESFNTTQFLLVSKPWLKYSLELNKWHSFIFKLNQLLQFAGCHLCWSAWTIPWSGRMGHLKHTWFNFYLSLFPSMINKKAHQSRSCCLLCVSQQHRSMDSSKHVHFLSSACARKTMFYKSTLIWEDKCTFMPRSKTTLALLKWNHDK